MYYKTIPSTYSTWFHCKHGHEWLIGTSSCQIDFFFFFFSPLVQKFCSLFLWVSVFLVVSGRTEPAPRLRQKPGPAVSGFTLKKGKAPWGSVFCSTRCECRTQSEHHPRRIRLWAQEASARCSGAQQRKLRARAVIINICLPALLRLRPLWTLPPDKRCRRAACIPWSTSCWCGSPSFP